MAQAYDAIIATITVASDASQVTKAMVKSTQWRAGTSGAWLSTDCTLTAGNTYQFRTPLSGMSFGSTAILPNIKASVTVDWDTTATPISTVGDYFMYSYADSCTNLTSLSVPDTSGLTTVGNYFMAYCAYNCSNLTSLSVPGTSGLTSVGTNFMAYYAFGCSSLTSLSVPDTSGLTSVGNYFMYRYAYGCSNLTSLSVPNTSGLTTVGSYFMRYYAQGCSSLTSLILPDSTGWFGSHDVDWSVPSGRLGYLYGYAPNPTSQTAWQGLTVSGKTLYTNYIRSVDNVILSSIVVPTVTTSTCSDVAQTSATGNGNITDTGGENCTRRGFCYMEGTSGDPTTSNSVVYDDGGFGTGAFTKSITGLSAGTNYRVRAYAVNSAGTGYGTTVQLTTRELTPVVGNTYPLPPFKNG